MLSLNLAGIFNRSFAMFDPVPVVEPLPVGPAAASHEPQPKGDRHASQPFRVGPRLHATRAELTIAAPRGSNPAIQQSTPQHSSEFRTLSSQFCTRVLQSPTLEGVGRFTTSEVA